MPSVGQERHHWDHEECLYCAPKSFSSAACRLFTTQQAPAAWSSGPGNEYIEHFSLTPPKTPKLEPVTPGPASAYPTDGWSLSAPSLSAQAREVLRQYERSFDQTRIIKRSTYLYSSRDDQITGQS
ncbi:hypothetical protein N7475_006712 [Penicillium sp. IBT 31633x]|nr:hypothetical protein N7475_006712 [Penicillium sp. IBT 31633x]